MINFIFYKPSKAENSWCVKWLEGGNRKDPNDKEMGLGGILNAITLTTMKSSGTPLDENLTETMICFGILTPGSAVALQQSKSPQTEEVTAVMKAALAEILTPIHGRK